MDSSTANQLISAIHWHSRHTPAWDDNPWAYVEHGILPPGRSRRLGVLSLDSVGFKAYLGVQHFDPGLWGYRGTAYCKFFLSLWTGKVCRELRTYPTMEQALERLRAFYTAAFPSQRRN